jgi:L-asparagine transporter-like permease
VNGVVISAALSSANTNLYLTTRMLFSLARSGDAPGWLGRLSASGVPRLGLAASTGGMVAAILLVVFAPARAFLLLYGTAVAGMLFIWIVTLVTHVRFRRALTPPQTADLPIRLPAHPLPSVLAAAALVAIAGTTFAVPGLEYTVIAFVPFLAVISIPYWWRRRAGRPVASPGDHDGRISDR